MIEFKSKSELYLSYYLEELKENGFIEEWFYEFDTFPLTSKVSLPYIKQLVTKTKESYESIMQSSSITADFSIRWNKKAKNIFYLDTDEPVKNVTNIPFRLAFLTNISEISFIEAKQANTFRANTSDISFPYKQKFLYSSKGIYIQKVVPFNLKPKPTSLFYNTFVPKRVLEEEVYKQRVKKKGKVIYSPGDSKFKFTPRTLEQFINNQKS